MSFSLMPHPQRIQRTLRYAGPCEVLANADKCGASICIPNPEASEPPQVISLSGKDSGEVLPGLLVPPNKVVKLVLGSVTPSRAHALVSVNPALLEVAFVNQRHIFEPDVTSELALYIQARNQVDLASFDWILKLYAQSTK